MSYPSPDKADWESIVTSSLLGQQRHPQVRGVQMVQNFGLERAYPVAKKLCWDSEVIVLEYEAKNRDYLCTKRQITRWRSSLHT